MTIDDLMRDFPSRLAAGRNILGPEFAGCSGTGRRACITVPAIHRAGTRRLQGLGWILVGDEMDVREAVGGSATKWTVAKDRGKHPTLNVWKFRTRGPAVAKFRALNERVLKFNAEVRAEAAQARADARSSDPRRALAGALALAGM